MSAEVGINKDKGVFCMASVEIENRRGRRQPFDDDFTFDTLSTPGSHEGGVYAGRASGIDISEKGMALETIYPLRDRQMLRLMLPIKNLGITSAVLGEVRWTTRTQGKFRAGVRFLV